MINIEKRSRVIVGILALAAVAGFMATTFGSSTGVLITQIIIGISLGIFLLTEAVIIDYFSQKKYKSISLSDIMVWIGVIVGISVIIFSISLIPTIGQILPVAIKSFTTNFARIIAGIAIIVAVIDIFTPRQS